MTLHAHPPVSARTRRLLGVVLLPLVLATIIGAVVLWPSGAGLELRPAGEPLDARVVTVSAGPCADTAPDDGGRCVRVEALVAGGGRVALDEVPAPEASTLAAGDRIVVRRLVTAGEVRYELAGRERSGPMAILVAAVAALVVLLARWRGLLLLAALAAAAAVLVVFAVPALLHGADPLAVGVVGAALVAIVLLALGHGVDARTATALVGCLLGVGAVGLVAQLVTEAAELASLGAGPGYLDVGTGTVPVRGLLVAGLLIGTVGGLADLALRLVDATWDLRDAEPDAGWSGVARAGIRRGRGHLSAVAGTLLIAYAGTALPVVVLLSAGDQGVLDAVQGEVVAVEVVRAAVAVLALALTVPLTAAMAAGVVVGEARRRSPGDPRRFRSRHERRIWEDDAP